MMAKGCTLIDVLVNWEHTLHNHCSLILIHTQGRKADYIASGRKSTLAMVQCTKMHDKTIELADGQLCWSANVLSSQWIEVGRLRDQLRVDCCCTCCRQVTHSLTCSVSQWSVPRSAPTTTASCVVVQLLPSWALRVAVKIVSDDNVLCAIADRQTGRHREMQQQKQHQQRQRRQAQPKVVQSLQVSQRVR